MTLHPISVRQPSGKKSTERIGWWKQYGNTDDSGCADWGEFQGDPSAERTRHRRTDLVSWGAVHTFAVQRMGRADRSFHGRQSPLSGAQGTAFRRGISDGAELHSRQLLHARIYHWFHVGHRPEEDWKKWSNRIFLIRFRVDWQRKCKRLHFRIFDICRRVTELHPSLIGCEDSCFCIMQINIKLIHHSFSQRLNI